tara:strand:+ start:979 stop:1140 length:162 start_codon:yes stop_codon:yes gene_type:complete
MKRFKTLPVIRHIRYVGYRTKLEWKGVKECSHFGIPLKPEEAQKLRNIWKGVE